MIAFFRLLSSLKAFILNYGAGNLTSCYRFVNSDLGLSGTIGTPDQFKLQDADLLVIPGVGHFGLAAPAVTTDSFLASAEAFVRAGKMIIGICLGAQLLGSTSEEAESDVPGLGLLPFTCKSLVSHQTYEGKVPRTGWSSIQYDGERYSFYFVHSYYMSPTSCDAHCIRIHTCIEDQVPAYITSSSANIHALQFHPEKSANDGLSFMNRILKAHA